MTSRGALRESAAGMAGDREAGDLWGLGNLPENLVVLDLWSGLYEDAAAHLREGVQTAWPSAPAWSYAACLAGQPLATRLWVIPPPAMAASQEGGNHPCRGPGWAGEPMAQGRRAGQFPSRQDKAMSAQLTHEGIQARTTQPATPADRGRLRDAWHWIRLAIQETATRPGGPSSCRHPGALTSNSTAGGEYGRELVRRQPRGGDRRRLGHWPRACPPGRSATR